MTSISSTQNAIQCSCGEAFGERLGHEWRTACKGCGSYTYPVRHQDGRWSAHCVQCHYERRGDSAMNVAGYKHARHNCHRAQAALGEHPQHCPFCARGQFCAHLAVLRDARRRWAQAIGGECND